MSELSKIIKWNLRTEKRTIMERNNSLGGMNSSLKKTEYRLNNFENKWTEFIQCEEQGKKMKKIEPQGPWEIK